MWKIGAKFKLNFWRFLGLFVFFFVFFFFLFDEMPIETEKINMKSTHREIKRRNLHRGSISFSTAPKPEEIGAVLFI